MKRDEIPNLGSLVDQSLVSVFYDTDKDENIIALNLNFKDESLIILGNLTIQKT